VHWKLGQKMRVAAEVDGMVLGFVSSETPVRQGRRKMALVYSSAGKAQVVYATAA